MISMKLFYLVLSMFFIPISTYAQQNVDSSGVKMAFDSEHINLGKVIKGEKVEFDYSFTNQGSEVIEIEIVSGCECTTLDWPRKKIHPGEVAAINVIFDSSEKEESEVVDVDITFKNIDPKTGDQIFKILTYSFDLVID